MDDFRVAAKAFIIQDGKVLLLKRRANDIHRSGEWDIPGGRLEPGEDPFLGVKRETKEESHLDIEIVLPLDIHHFVRQDGQKITMIIFLCTPLSDDIVLSEEHTEYKWVDTNTKEEFPHWLHSVLKSLGKYKLGLP